MPRPRKQPLFELAGQWIAQEPGRQGLWRYWYDAGAARVRRQPLGTDDLEEAKIRLAMAVVQEERPTTSTELAAVMLRYHVEHTNALRSAKMAKYASKKVLDFVGQHALVDALTPDMWRDFARKMVSEGSSASYIARIVGVIAAGIKHARITGIDVPTGEAWIDRVAPGAKAARKVPMPTDDQVAALLSYPIAEPLFRWALISLGTGARPEAALDLRPEQRRDGLIDLNPPDRRQNKKHRPIVREPSILTSWLDEWAKSDDRHMTGRFVAYANVSAVQSALDRLAAPDALGIQLSAYSLRHKVTTVLRRAKRHGVTEDDIAWQLGHRRPHLRTTGGYGEFEPDYLDAPAQALDTWLRGLGFSRKTPAKRGGRRLATIKNRAASNG